MREICAYEIAMPIQRLVFKFARGDLGEAYRRAYIQAKSDQVGAGQQDSRSGGPNPPPRLAHTEGYEAARGKSLAAFIGTGGNQTQSSS
jgi:hypothetical protein